MKDNFIVFIKEVSSGKVVEYIDPYLFDEERGIVDTYNWEEGNYSCDCNRKAFFYGSSGYKKDRPCGDLTYIVQIRNMKTNEIIYDEFHDE